LFEDLKTGEEVVALLAVVDVVVVVVVQKASPSWLLSSLLLWLKPGWLLSSLLLWLQPGWLLGSLLLWLKPGWLLSSWLLGSLLSWLKPVGKVVLLWQLLGVGLALGLEPDVLLRLLLLLLASLWQPKVLLRSLWLLSLERLNKGEWASTLLEGIELREARDNVWQGSASLRTSW
jgi:hypothetical protein